MIIWTIPSDDDVRVGMLDKTVWARIPLTLYNLHFNFLFVSPLVSDNIVFIQLGLTFVATNLKDFDWIRYYPLKR